MKNLEAYRNKIDPGAYSVYERAFNHSSEIVKKAGIIIENSLKGIDIDDKSICIAAVGSLARNEALTASDLDIIPIWSGDRKLFPRFADVSGKIREDLRVGLKMDVSTSRDLMRSTELQTLCKADEIGGDRDYRRTLTQRMLVLSESVHLGGELDLSEVRKKVLQAYVGDRSIERTVSRHPLAVCNDVVRYYRTLCVDYKSRAETRPESWAERHAKLRNARKFWYFSTVLALSKIASDSGQMENTIVFDNLAQALTEPPVVRLLSAVNDENKKYAFDLLCLYSKYLLSMSDQEFRKKLEMVEFDDREKNTLPNGEINPYKDMLERSREFSDLMIEMMLHCDQAIKKKIFSWFFL